MRSASPKKLELRAEPVEVRRKGHVADTSRRAVLMLPPAHLEGLR